MSVTAAESGFRYPTAARDARARLLARIGSDWGTGDRLPPIRQLAQELGIGQGSVNVAVQQLVKEGRLVSRPRLGTFVTGTGAPGDKVLTGKIIRFLVSAAPDPMVTDMLNAARDEFAQLGATLHVQAVPIAKSLNPPPLQIDPHAHAIVVVNPNSKPRIIGRPGQFLLLIQTAIARPILLPAIFDEVTVDQENAAALAGARLRDAGCRSICFVGRHEDDDPSSLDSISRLRLNGFEAGWHQPVPKKNQLGYISYGEGSGARLAAEYAALNPRPDGVFAASDELAVGFVKGALALGMEPGRDYQIVGFDGQERGRTMEDGPLTTVQVPWTDLGRRGAELLIDRFRNPDQPARRLQMGCTLFEGNTVHRLVEEKP